MFQKQNQILTTAVKRRGLDLRIKPPTHEATAVKARFRPFTICSLHLRTVTVEVRRNIVDQVIEAKSDGLIGVFVPLMKLQEELSPEDFKLFCDNTPNGKELWLAFKTRRDAPDAPADYGFTHYAEEILNNLKQPSS